ncbi:MAG: helix-turn-helix domain-containing protein [bacterium]|nr:helix-turn-helix domain-containing protein [bacterium]
MKNTVYDVNTVGDRLRAIREELGISMRELAAKADVAASFVSRVEAGKASPTIMTLQKLLHALNVEVVDFFEREHAPDPARQVVFRRSDMQALSEADRRWMFAFPSHPDISLVMTYEEYQPETELVEEERHARDTYGQVLSGQLTIEIPGRDAFVAKRGDAFFLKAGTKHASRNSGKSVLKMVVAQIK